MSAVLEKLFAGMDLTREEVRDQFASLLRGELSESEIAALLVALKIKGETSEEIAGAAEALRADARPFPRPEDLFADVVGTGGDGSHTINISTAVALVAAEAGLPIAKHGNRSVSSKCGAADLLESFGVRLDMSPSTARRMLTECGMTFLFAPHYHQGIRHAMPVRKALATRTIFNVLGPLLNPAQPPVMLVGVYAPELCSIIAKSLSLLGCERALVVHGSGLDEIALHGPTLAFEVMGGELRETTLTPEIFGASPAPLAALVGGVPDENREIFEKLLSGEGTEAQNDAVSVNAGALLKTAGKAESYAEGYAAAREILAGGQAITRLEKVAKMSQEEAHVGPC